MRYCDLCGGLDDHPRHVQAVPVGTPGAAPSPEFLESLGDGPAFATALLLTPTSLIRHLDCCAAAGCGTCVKTEAATRGVRGKKLIDAIAAGALDNVEV